MTSASAIVEATATSAAHVVAPAVLVAAPDVTAVTAVTLPSSSSIMSPLPLPADVSSSSTIVPDVSSSASDVAGALVSSAAAAAAAAAASAAASTSPSAWAFVQSLVRRVLDIHCDGVCPHSSCVLSIIRGVQHGIVYGTKVRLPHAFVMTMLWKNGTFAEKLREILSLTYQHARNLGLCVAVYKIVTCTLRHTRRDDDLLNSLVGGACAGALVFGQDTPINMQINMYIMSRVIFGAARVLVEHKLVPNWEHSFRLYAAVCWALVMVLFESRPHALQKSLTSSMNYLYHDSNKVPENAEGVIDWLFMGVA